MKKFLSFFAFLVFFTININAQNSVASDTLPILQFDKIEHDFGKIKEGTLAIHPFEFTNKGKSPLVITNVIASCGCTTPEWSKEPIAPGAKGLIKAAFNSYGRPGQFHKTITVISNAGANVVLSIKGDVLLNTQEPVSPVRNN
ncbi:MAG: DUF1573 domain-containing protein [Bacteroidia bacterium]|nr:DUF1573 domain-containing protein [Bacteroidia bacterium]MCZ2141428.1 DUF1573 domain-containing protein [Bacteroidia bacterium]